MFGALALLACQINGRIAEHRLYEVQSLVVLLAFITGFTILRLRGRTRLAPIVGMTVLSLAAGMSRGFVKAIVPFGPTDAYFYWKESHAGGFLLAQTAVCGVFIAISLRRPWGLVLLGMLAITSITNGLMFLWSGRALLTLGRPTWAEVCAVSFTSLRTNIFTDDAMLRAAEWGAAACAFCLLYSFAARWRRAITSTS